MTRPDDSCDSVSVQVEYRADSLQLDLIELSRTGNRLLSVHGRVQYMCQTIEAADPVSFASRGSYLVSGAQLGISVVVLLVF